MFSCECEVGSDLFKDFGLKSHEHPRTCCSLIRTLTLWALFCSHSLAHRHTESREEWALYWYLRQGGKNIFLPIFLSEVNRQHPSPPHFLSLSLPHSLSQLPCLHFSLLPRPPPSVCLHHTLYVSVWESLAVSAGPQGPFHAADVHGGCRL